LKLLQFIYRHTLNSVWFGIITMLLVGLYVAVGSGMPNVRAYFEMSDLEFFAAWPLKMLMAMLVANLVCVTWERIPLTPPRYGVWCVHAGIITLIFGMATYYSRKIEGTTMVPVGATVNRFYDSQSRMLYVRANGRDASAHTLPGLPRFKVYSAEQGNDGYLRRAGLTGMEPSLKVRNAQGQAVSKPLAEMLGAKDFKIDIVGYYPYATVIDRYVEGGGNLSGVKLVLNAPHMGVSQTEYVINGEPGHEMTMLGSSEVRHVKLGDAAGMDEVAKAAEHIHLLDVKAPGYEKVIPVTVGGKYELGSSGYTVTVEGFDPNWPTMEGERAKLITLMVERKGGEAYRRQLIMGREKPTDWKLNEPGAGPMGKRQPTPLDDQLQVQYSFKDMFGLVPDRGGAERHTVFTFADGKLLADVVVAMDRAPSVHRFEDGAGDVEMSLGQMRMNVGVAKVDGLARDERVEEVPAAQRTRAGGESGVFQVVLAKVTSGDWSKVVPVPFTQFVLEPGVPWSEGRVQVPGTDVEVQLAFGNEFVPLPAEITLDKFELVHYPGGDERSMIQRDFKSHLTIRDLGTERVTRAMAHMNNPAYWPPMPRAVAGYGFRFPWERAGEWLFFQAAWDAEGQRWTILGIGNRPGMLVMTTGCVMIFLGVIYAFYVKPIVIRRMKANALAKAQKAGKKPKKELVSV
jgi:hypothetical protein